MKYFSVKTTGVALCAGFSMTMSANDFSYENNNLPSALLEIKADPIIGLSARKNYQENVVGATFSIPLNIRNDYSANEKPEKQKNISTQASLRLTFRKQKFLIQANTDSLISNKHYLERRTKLMRDRGDNSPKLLHKEWQTGYLNTSQYLLALQRRVEGLYAGIDLKTQFKLSEVEWLLSLGRISAATKQLS